MTEPTITVMIIGAGGAGRLLAQGLQKRGYRCTLFERDESLDARERDWDYGVHWATTLLDDLLPEHITKEKVLRAQVDHLPVTPESKLNVYNGATGETIVVVPIPNMMRLRRREFCRVLGEGLDIRYDKRLESITSDDAAGTVTATFTDGTRHTASLLIGADGSRSITRRFLVGDEKAEPKRPPVNMSLVRCSLSKDQVDEYMKLTDRIWLTFHPNGGLAMMSVHDAYDKPDPATWRFSLTMCWRVTNPTRGPGVPGDGPSVIRDIKKVFSNYGEPFRSIITSMSEDDETAWAGHSGYWSPEPWPDHSARGRVTLIGDAMHSLLPQRGQGMNNAILDCVDFFKELDAEPAKNAAGLAAAIARYEETVWKRGREAVEESVENAFAITEWETLKTSPLWKFGIAQKGLRSTPLNTTE